MKSLYLVRKGRGNSPCPKFFLFEKTDDQNIHYFIFSKYKTCFCCHKKVRNKTTPKMYQQVLIWILTTTFIFQLLIVQIRGRGVGSKTSDKFITPKRMKKLNSFSPKKVKIRKHYPITIKITLRAMNKTVNPPKAKNIKTLV